MLESLYLAAASAGLLHECTWQPADGREVETRPVGFRAPDVSVFDGLGVSTDYAITYPGTWFFGLTRQDHLSITQHFYLVREIRAIGDGSERHATLTRL